MAEESEHRAEQSIYTVGGTVQANEQGLYIPRAADVELLQLCRRSTFAYVLTPRQMGKSSLMIRTAEQLIEDGWQAVIIDLTQIGTQVSAEEWYRGLLTLIADQLLLTTNIADWWQAQSHLGITQRLTQFLQQVVLSEVESPVVVFVDEIDTTLSLDFTDDFYAAIRYLYVARARQAEFRRLSFVLIGVATPGDLIRDAKRTPFNIGQRVDLTDFSLTEAMPLGLGLGLTEPEAERALGWVLQWTGGHPYLTQRLCQEMAQVGGETWTEAQVERLVGSTFLGAQSEQDNNLQFVRDMLTKRAAEPVAVLQTYRQIRRGKPAVIDEEQSLVKSHLKLSGVVKREGRALRVRNRIYQRVFNSQWIREHLPTLRPPIRPALLASVLVAILVVGVRFFGFLEPLELGFYDQLIRFQSESMPVDERLLVVEVTDADVEKQAIRDGEILDSLSNRTLTLLLEKLDELDPVSIGLDIYRNYRLYRSVDDIELQRRFESQTNLFTICKVAYGAEVAILPPFGVSSERVGFLDIVFDSDGVLRRQLLAFNPDSVVNDESSCRASYSFSLVLANHFLKFYNQEPIESKTSWGSRIQDNSCGLQYSNGVKFPYLYPFTGGYQALQSVGGCQVMLNYRSENDFEIVTVEDILNGESIAPYYKNRIILIGVTRYGGGNDYWLTPLGIMPGVMLQAQMISQILDAVSGKHPLIWVLPQWRGIELGEVVWIFSWSLVGGLLAWYLQSSLRLLIVGGATLIALYLFCVSLLLFFGGWLPFVPSLLAFIFTSAIVVARYETISRN